MTKVFEIVIDLDMSLVGRDTIAEPHVWKLFTDEKGRRCRQPMALEDVLGEVIEDLPPKHGVEGLTNALVDYLRHW